MDKKIILSATWVVVTLIYLYGDVLRIYYGGDKAKALADMKLNQFVWLGIAVLMLTPILMVFLTLYYPSLRIAGRISSWLPSFSCSTWLACPPIHRYLTNSC
jgi:hypothetical protein